MGKTPSKWFKTLLLGKKSPKPRLSKDKDILSPAYVGERETLITLTAPPTGLTENPPPNLLPNTKANGSNDVDQDEVVVNRVPNVETPSTFQSAGENLLLQTHSLEDHEKVRLHEAATKAQAAYRGYLARRAFRTLKGIVRLQALIRGHLVRRQAIATLCCLRSIVKLQAVIRRRKDPQYATPLTKFEVKTFKHVCIQKLLSPTLSARPLRLQYAHGDPNSVLEWLERWTKSRFWDRPPVQQPKKKLKPQPKPKQLAAVEIDQTRPKRSARKVPSSNGEMVPSRSSSQTEKVKRQIGKASGGPTSQNGHEKSKINLRKTRDPAEVVDLDKKKSDHSAQKAPDTPACDEVVEPVATMNNIGEEDRVETANRNKSLEPAGEELSHDLTDEVDELSLTELNKAKSNTAAATEKELNSEDVIDYQESSNRRVSLPTKMENGASSSTPRRPSYMAPTKSAKAKLKAQGSSSPPTDDAEKNGYTRRFSLPNGKITSFSPRAHKQVVASTTKGAIKTVKSLPSSKDGSDNANKAGWKR